MPPKRAKKNASDASVDAIPSFPAPPITRAQQEEAHTPEQSPRKQQAVGITQAQKQALIDNLQLEITERARKLRAQYALQAQGLRSRLEMRVNRIPTALRKRKIGELLEEYAEKAAPKPAPGAVVKEAAPRAEAIEERPAKAVKKTSEHISTDYSADDKENAEPAPAPQSQSQDLPVTKKRATKTTAATANTKATRTASRANARPLQPSTVLSPKSHNSRTLPRSPIKNTSPEKPLPTRPINTAKPATARTASRQQPAVAKKPAAQQCSDREERSSGVSDSSAGTTIMRKAAPAPAAATSARGRVAAAARKGAAAVGRAAGGGGGSKKAAAAKKENVAPVAAAAGGRTLRKRG